VRWRIFGRIVPPRLPWLTPLDLDEGCFSFVSNLRVAKKRSRLSALGTNGLAIIGLQRRVRRRTLTAPYRITLVPELFCKLSFHRLGVFPGHCWEVLIQVWQEPDAVLASILVALVSRPVVLKALFGGQPRLPNVDARQVWIMAWIRGSELWLAENRVVELNDVDNVVKIRYLRASRTSWPDYVYVDPYNIPNTVSSANHPTAELWGTRGFLFGINPCRAASIEKRSLGRDPLLLY